MGVAVLLVVSFLVLHGLFAGVEIAILSVRKTRLREFIRRKDKRALAVEKLRDEPEEFLASISIFIAIMGTVASVVGGANIEPVLATYLEQYGLGHTTSFVVVISAIVFFELVIGELVPKSLALRYSDRYSFLTARMMVLLSKLMRPLIWLLTVSSNIVLRFFSDKTTFTETRLSRDELQQLVEEAAKTGSVDPRASEIASRALGFGEVTVAEVMVPRNRVVALRRSAPPEEVQRVILEEGHSRMPVYDSSIDNIVGYVVARDVLALAWEKGLVVLEDILRPPHKVPESTRALDLLRELQRRRRHHERGRCRRAVLRPRAERHDPGPGLGGSPQGQSRLAPRPACRQGPHDHRRPLHVAGSGHSPGRGEADHRQRDGARNHRGFAAPRAPRADPSRG
jgi:putative hemolysin